eukprot:m.189214 g.189214  ORF g.189214 m.189214 type:complete len:254 (+) comp17544_c1_seq11:94-855(+)
MMNEESRARQQQPQQQPSAAIKLGVVYLGKVCGKHKYTLLDESDIQFARNYTLGAYVDVDRNGTGAKVFATVLTPGSEADDNHPILFHNLLWTKKYGHVVPGCRISHKNGITVDNRISNLELVSVDPATSMLVPQQLTPEEVEQRNKSAELYEVALGQLPPHSTQHHSTPACTLNADGDKIDGSSAPVLFFECHRAACCKMERHLNEFAVCGRCFETRYCSPACQEQDWAQHKRECSCRPSPMPAVTFNDVLR